MRKKILVVDPLSYSGHVNYNHGIIRAISRDFDYDIIVNDFMAYSLRKKGIKEECFIKKYPKDWSIESLSKKMNKISYHIAFRFFFLKVLWNVILNQKKYDGIIITCIDVYSFMLISWLFSTKTCVVDHGIGNIEKNKVYKWCWLLISKKIRIIVLEDFIELMVRKNLHNRNVYVVRHPLPVIHHHKIEIEKENEILIFAPSASNDEEFFDEIMQLKIPNDVTIIAKSNKSQYTSKNLIIYKGYISTDEYNHYISACDYILLAYDRTYNYRISAVLFEAVQLGKRVLLLSNNTLSYYAEIFGEDVLLFDTPQKMLEIIKNNKLKKVDYSKRDLYSDANLASSISKALE